MGSRFIEGGWIALVSQEHCVLLLTCGIKPGPVDLPPLGFLVSCVGFMTCVSFLIGTYVVVYGSACGLLGSVVDRVERWGEFDALIAISMFTLDLRAQSSRRTVRFQGRMWCIPEST